MAEEELTASALIHRDLGRLEGRITALESRQEMTERGVSAIGQKIDRLDEKIEAVLVRNAGADGKQKGSNSAYAVIGSAILAVLSFIGTAAMAIGSFVHK